MQNIGAAHVIWGTSIVSGSHVIWGSNVIWGTSVIWGTNVIWGTVTGDSAESIPIAVVGEP